jgi:ATP-dependent Lhr-like helicase
MTPIKPGGKEPGSADGMPDKMSPSFHPLVRAWFIESYGKPTAVQEEAWPLIAEGKHVLALAPTGSGKTLTAFLTALSRFIDGSYRAELLSVLYVSPLKALNEDIRRNLLEPLAGLGRRFADQGLPFPDIRVQTRSGDTPQGERRRFLINPPSILALTPESLAILLLNPKGRQVLSSVRCLILDEIHAVLGTKRGAFLSCQIDRLAMSAGEFQRVALSATVKPAESAAEFVGGLRRKNGASGEYEGRPVYVAAPREEKRIELGVDFPSLPAEGEEKLPGRYGPRYTVLIDYILERIRPPLPDSPSRTVLVFTDSRRRAERIAFLINQQAGETTAYAHHGSLSRELRRAVEQRLSEGRLSCVVATGSLELGIDIGSVDEVILAGCPSAAATALQRIGRSGHGVGMTSRGRIVPFHGMDLLLAAALAGAVRDREIEETRAILNPLDILAQLILALCAERSYVRDELFTVIRGFYVFRTLSRSSFDRVTAMLTGRQNAAGTPGDRIRDIKPRLYLDALSDELFPVRGLTSLLYTSGGVIPSRGYYSLRLAGSMGAAAGTKIGELDEEFVWERRLGDSFDFGNRHWTIAAIGAEAVEVIPREAGADFTPFWRAEAAFRSPLLVRRILELFDALQRSSSPAEGMELLAGLGLSPDAAGELWGFIKKQREIQGDVPLPGSLRLPVEIVDEPATGAYSVILHSFRGGAVHYPLALALAQELEAVLQTRVEAFPDDNCILIVLPRSAGEPEALLSRALRALQERGEERFRSRLESSGIFGAAFREAAERSLVLPRSSFGKRIPLWVIRQRAKRLFDALSSEKDSPIIAEAWRSCLGDQFDMEGFLGLLAELRSGGIELRFFRTGLPSPFAGDVIWKETSAFMYTYDERPDLLGGGQSLSNRVIAEALADAGLRPPLPASLVADFSARLRRELPGWAPDTEQALCEWVKERIALPWDEWELLRGTLPEELRETLEADPALGGRLRSIQRKGAALPSLVHREWEAAWREEAAAQLGPWLRYEGPLSLSRVAGVFGLSPAETEDGVQALAEAGDLIRNVRIAGFPEGDELVCDRENLDLLLRLKRKQNRSAGRERPPALLIPYLALRQGIAGDRSFPGVMQALQGFSAPIALWETEIFPARLPYVPELLDRELEEGKLFWYGTGKERAAFCIPQDMDLILPENPGPLKLPGPVGFFDRPRDFWEIREALGLDGSRCMEFLWEAAWEGRLSSDSWEPLRHGMIRGFVPKQGETVPGAALPPSLNPPGLPRSFRRRPLPRALRDRWKAGAPVSGKWFSLIPDYGGGPEDHSFPEADPLDEEEINRDRIRLLLARWGVLCRPLMEREAAPLSWIVLLPAMRRMELAGELREGRFFGGINSLQFAAPAIEKELEAAERFAGEGRIYWMNAADCASPAGLGVEGLDPRLPARTGGARICFRGTEAAAVSERSGRELRIFLSPGDADLPAVLAFLKTPRTRAVHAVRKITLETINGVSAATGAYAGILRELGFIADRGKLLLW